MTDDSGCTDIGCCCDSSSVANGSDAVEFGDHRLDPVQLAVRSAAFRLLIDSGQPAAIASIAKAAGVEPAKAAEVLDGFTRTGNVSMKGDRVVGIAGLSIEPTQHRIELAVGQRWTWCALDAIGIVGTVGDGVIHSQVADGAMRLNVRNGELESNDLAVLIPDGYGMTSAVDQWCPLANFFPTVASATAWAKSNGVEGKATSVTAIASQLIERWRTVLNHHQPQ